MTENQLLVHATCISIDGHGVLLRGPPGSGKSSLALQLMESRGDGLSGSDMRAQLISDDQTLLTNRANALMATAPANIQGFMEVRGYGLISVKVLRTAPVLFAVDLMPWQDIDRMAEVGFEKISILAVDIYRMALDPSQPSAPARLRLALRDFKEM